MPALSKTHARSALLVVALALAVAGSPVRDLDDVARGVPVWTER